MNISQSIKQVTTKWKDVSNQENETGALRRKHAKLNKRKKESNATRKNGDPTGTQTPIDL